MGIPLCWTLFTGDIYEFYPKTNSNFAVDGRNPKWPPGIYINLVKQWDKLHTSTGERRISSINSFPWKNGWLGDYLLFLGLLADFRGNLLFVWIRGMSQSLGLTPTDLWDAHGMTSPWPSGPTIFAAGKSMSYMEFFNEVALITWVIQSFILVLL